MASISRSRSLALFVLILVLAASIIELPVAQDESSVSSVQTARKMPLLRSAQLTPEGLPYWTITSGSRISSYSHGSGNNNREMIWDDNVPESASAVQCATWSSGSGIAQNGFVFRIARQSGGYNAIVFARNIYMYWFWRFAPKMFHTGSDYENDWSDVPGIDLDAYLGQVEINTWPLRVCASFDSSNVLRFAVAKGSDPMPSLTNPGIQGGSWKLDMTHYYHPGEGLSGKNGGTFIAHTPPGTALVVEGDSTITLDDVATKPVGLVPLA